MVVTLLTLDVGGAASAETVKNGLETFSDKNVKSILINIFGGIVMIGLLKE